MDSSLSHFDTEDKLYSYKNVLHCCRILRHLHCNQKQGIGTDLEILCPELDKHKTFHVHSCVVAANSDYFETFPTPRKGRIIDEIEASIFEICVIFLYTGTLELITHDNVASILAASQLLGIRNLSDACFKYLEDHLDHSNYAVVRDLGDQFHNIALSQKALRFSSPNMARDLLVARRKMLSSQCDSSKLQVKKYTSQNTDCKRRMQKLNEQWSSIIESELKKAALDMKVKCDLKEEKHTLPDYPTSFYKERGSVGRIVCSDSKFGLNYEGENKYRKTENANTSSTEHPNFFSLLYSHVPQLPPPPTDEQYQKYGIVFSYGSLDDALCAADPGDRIYFDPGRYESVATTIEKSVEIIGLGKSNDDVVLAQHKADLGEPFISIENCCVRMKNITLSTCEPYDHEVEVDSAHPLCHMGKNAELFLQECKFVREHDGSYNSAAKVTGLYIKGGTRAIIDRCVFKGGSGSAIGVFNDPKAGSAPVQQVIITRSTFINTGAPSQKDNSLIPTPAAVELWRHCRPPRFHIQSGKRETFHNANVSIVGNCFTHNFSAAVACRNIVNRSEASHFSTPHESIPRVGFEFPDFDKDGSLQYSELDGYEVRIAENTCQNNGMGFAKEFVSKWDRRNSPDLNVGEDDDVKEPNAKRVCVDCPQAADLLDPNGEPMLVIYQFIDEEFNFPISMYGSDEDEYTFTSPSDEEDDDGMVLVLRDNHLGDY